MTDRQKALRDWREQLKEWREEECPDALCVDTRVTSVIRITYGGPSVLVEYDHTTGRARYVSSAHNSLQRIDLTDEEAAEVAELFALEETLAGRVSEGVLGL